MIKPVLVMGGGIAGVQASLDLAEMGVPVFLVENSPSIGGKMAQLDKTFPTNDCSACILAPKITSCYNHHLVKTLTCSELVELKGEAPDFTAIIRKKARFIEEELCKGCNACIYKCPVERKSEFDEGIGLRKAVYKPHAQAVPNKVVIDKKGTSPCKYNCPAHMDIHACVALARQGRYREAVEAMRRTTPFAGVLGRICPHPCESACARRYVDAPLSLAALERFVADFAEERGIVPPVKAPAQKKDEKVAIIGAGPAGLNCAYRLALEGYGATVFEALAEPGGMARVGIPGYRLDKKVLDREIQIIKDLGVEIRCNMPLGRSLTLSMLKEMGYKAVFLATGAHAAKKPGIPGEELPGVIDALEFLRELNLGGNPPNGAEARNGEEPLAGANTSGGEKPHIGGKLRIGGKVVVIGGTRAAVEAARSAVRLGSRVVVVFGGGAEDMDVTRVELEQAEEEGVKFEFMAAPVEIAAADGKAAGVRCRRAGLQKPGRGGGAEDMSANASSAGMPWRANISGSRYIGLFNYKAGSGAYGFGDAGMPESDLENIVPDASGCGHPHTGVPATGYSGIEGSGALYVEEAATSCVNEAEPSYFVIEAETVISAAGRSVDAVPLIEAGIGCFDADGRIACDPGTLETGIPGVFAGGDAVSPAEGVINAIAHGNMAARSIMNYLEGVSMPVKPYILPETPVEKIDFSGAEEGMRVEPAVAEPRARAGTFDEVEKGFAEEQAKKEAQRCLDCSVCCECRICEKMCGSGAIRHEQQDEMLEVRVSSVILADGCELSTDAPDGYGYGKYRDVVTGLEYERILSASGPCQGHVRRPSDGKAPERIAFIQCAGSRDEKCGMGYCSAVCCMYAVKEAVVTKEHLPSVKDIDIFYMDLRSYGKEFDRYVENAKSRHSIRFIRSRVSSVKHNGTTGRLMLEYCGEDGRPACGEYDMVVLSAGLKPDAGRKAFLDDIGVKTDRYGFIWTGETEAPKTSREGIFSCGSSTGPKDIPETVVEASAAAAGAYRTAAGLSAEREEYGAFFKEESEPAFRDVSREPARIGVFVCHCGKNIGDYVDVKEVAACARTLPGVEYAADFMYACSADSQKAMAERIARFKLNRVVVASCTPRTHEPLFRGVLASAGLNPFLLAMANIREQCSWVHMNNREDATQKAKDLVRMAAARIFHAKQLEKQTIGVIKTALVIGGGVAGMSAALEIAGMGYRVFLAEKTGTLGGNALKLNATFAGRPADIRIGKMISDVMSNNLIEVYLNTRVKNVEGYVGNFETTLESGDGREFEVRHGVAVIATGAKESRPKGYMYGVHENVITQMELEETLKNSAEALKGKKGICMIQCVGSRNAERPYCSRVCCNQALKNAVILKEINPSAEITILYRDIRSYGLHEAYYGRARRAGVRFARYEAGQEPEIAPGPGGRLTVRFFEPVLGGFVFSEADMVVLGSAIEPEIEDNRNLSRLFKVPLNQDGFFMEAHAKLRPVDFATEGVFLCGMAHAPKNMKESIIQGKAAAARAAAVISKDALVIGGETAEVSEEYCTGCATCEKVCAYRAISVEEVKKRGVTVKKAVVNAALCKGCGTCAASCRCGAVDIGGFSDRQVLGEIERLLRI